MTAEIVDLRWIAPPGSQAHPRLALVRHDDRLFSFSELLVYTPREQAPASLESEAVRPQEWWDDLSSRLPSVANRIAGMCHPRDFEVLDLYAMRAKGCA